MWTQDEGSIDPVEKEVVDSGLMFIEGTTRNFSFGDSEINPLKLGLSMPILHFLKVHKEHPLKITNSSPSFVGIYPINEEERMPAKVFNDRNSWDITTFLLLPYEINGDDARHWEVHGLDNSFFAQGSDSGVNASLLYTPGHISINCSDVTQRYGFIPASQVQNQLYYWITQGHRLFGFDTNHESQELGRLEVPFEKARPITQGLIKELEGYYGEVFLFESQRRSY